MTILAIDPGFGRLGLAILTKEKNGEEVLYSTGVVTPTKLPFAERLGLIAEAVKKIIKQYQVDCLVLEKIYFAQNKTTALKVAEVRGMLLALAAQHHLRVAEYSPTEVKVAVTGYGHAGKTQVTAMVKKLVKLPAGKRLDDELDAIAIGLTHLASPSYPQ